jgi:hypothetical protein
MESPPVKLGEGTPSDSPELQTYFHAIQAASRAACVFYLYLICQEGEVKY